MAYNIQHDNITPHFFVFEEILEVCEQNVQNFFSLFVPFIGTSVRCSSPLGFGRLTGNDVSGHFNRNNFLSFWHERAAFQRSSFGRSRSGGRLLAMT